MTAIMSVQATISSYSGIGGWNDMDMLEVGNGGMSDSEEGAHFSICIALQVSPFLFFVFIFRVILRILLNRGHFKKPTHYGKRSGYTECQ